MMAGTPKKKKPLTERDRLKLEIISEIGLDTRLAEVGWDGLSAADCGRVGGCWPVGSDRLRWRPRDKPEGAWIVIEERIQNYIQEIDSWY